MKRTLLISALLLTVILSVNADRRRMLGVVRNVASASSPTPEIFWAKFNEGSGTTWTGYSSGGSDGGTHDATYTTGLGGGSGNSLDFDGTTGDGASTSTIVCGANVITICFWVNSDVNDNATRMYLESSANALSGVDRFVVYSDTSGLKAYSGGTTGAREEYVARPGVGVTTHYAIVIDQAANAGAGEITFYVNGVSTATTISTNTKTGTANFSTQTLYLASRNRGTFFIDARMDDARIYNRALSGSEITDVYGNPQ